MLAFLSLFYEILFGGYASYFILSDFRKKRKRYLQIYLATRRIKKYHRKYHKNFMRKWHRSLRWMG